LVRSILQKVLITGKPRTKVRFKRTLSLTDESVTIRDSIDASQEDFVFSSLAIGSDSTSIYVANSNTFQESTLLNWVDLDEHLPALNREKRLDLPPRVITGRNKA
jgi:hypothetical protein